MLAMQLKAIVVCVLGLAAILAPDAAAAVDATSRCQKLIDAKGTVSEPERARALFKLTWEVFLEESPESATQDGVPGYDHLWRDYSAEAIARRDALSPLQLRVAESIDPARLDESDRMSLELLKDLARRDIAEARFPGEYVVITQRMGVQQGAARVLAQMGRNRVSDLENQIARLRALPRWIDQVIALLETGLARQVTPPQITLRDVPQQVLNQIPDDPLQSPLLQGFAHMGAGVPDAERTRLRDEASKVYAADVVPAFKRLHAFLVSKYVPGARTTIGASALPDGEAWYAQLVKRWTTTDMTPRQVHDLGRAEVARIRAEMETMKTRIGFKGTMAEFFHHLRTEPKFFYTDKEQLLAGYRDIAKRADPELIKLFGTLPRQPYGVVPVPSYAEKSQTTAYYQPGSLAAGRAGQFFANTYALDTRPKWEMEALTLHEAVPGHHLQIALAQEIQGLPEFRTKSFGYTAFVEGWGLYAESLGEEMGFYQDPYSKFGQLTYEMWRAIRLVVDTGMHAFGWSRQQAIDYFLANAGKSEHDVTVEIDRYIVWPGQAVAYKIGELKLKELRARATQALGPKFDVRSFHDEVLRHGAIPLSVLEANIESWIAKHK